MTARTPPEAEFATASVRADLGSKSVRGAFFTSLGTAFDFVLRFGSIAVLAHLLLPEHFGLIGMVTAFTAIGASFAHLGLNVVSVQRTDINQAQLSTLFWINAAFGVVLGLAYCALAPLLAAFFREPRLVLATIVVSSTFVWTGLAVQHEALMTRRMDHLQMAMVRSLSLFASVCVGVGLALADFGYWALVWHEVSRSFFLMFGFWIGARWVPSRPSRDAGVGSMLRFGWHLTLSQILDAIILNLDRILLGRYFGAESVGIYRQAQQLIWAPVEQLRQPIQSVAQPALSIIKDDPERYRRYFVQIVASIGLLTMPLATFCGAYAEEVTLVVLGDRWLQAAALLQIFAIWAFLRPALGIAGVVLITLGQSRRLLTYSYLRNVAFVVLTIVGVQWGVIGVATAQVGATIILLLPLLYYSFAQTPVSPALFFLAVRVPVLGCTVMLGGVILLKWLMPSTSNLLELLVGAPVAAVLFVAGCLMTQDGRRLIGDLRRQLMTRLLRRQTQPAR